MTHTLILEPGRAERHYWRDLWRYRELFWVLAWRDVAVRYKQTVIGVAWALLQPLLTMRAQILSRITEPTTGRVTINGRVASLLEVGTGFHSELTGRENIFLTGAILGMNRKEFQTVGWAKAKAVPNKESFGRRTQPWRAGSIRNTHKSTSIPAIGQASVGSAGLTRCSNPAIGLDSAMSEWPVTGSSGGCSCEAMRFF